MSGPTHALSYVPRTTPLIRGTGASMHIVPARFQSSDESLPHGEKNKDTKDSKSKTKDKKDRKKKSDKEKKLKKKGRKEEEEDDEPDQEHTHVGKKR